MEETTTTEKYNITLPNGSRVEREIDKDEVEYWLSLGMYLAHGFQLLTMIFQSDKMDEEANVPLLNEEDPSLQ